MSSILLGYILYFSTLNKIDPNLVKAVVYVESRGNSELVGAAGEIGVMQLMPTTFPIGTSHLKDIRTNVALGTHYLAKMKQECPHQVNNTWLICYNTGVEGAWKIKHPYQNSYYKQVMNAYERFKQNND